MNKSVVLTLASALVTAPIFGQSIFSQFFNNTPAVGDMSSGAYNWSAATAASISMVANNVSSGYPFGASSGYVPSNGEEVRGGGFLFSVPAVNDVGQVPGAVLMYTTHMGTSTTFQSGPQPDWFLDGPTGPSGLTAAELISIKTQSNSGTAGITGRLALQINGTDWLISSTSLISQTSMVVKEYTNLLTESWITGGFSGGVVDDDLSDNGTTSITGTDVITGYGYYGDTDALGGNASRIRLDYISVTAVPEPAAAAALLGLGALGFAIWRRRR